MRTVVIALLSIIATAAPTLADPCNADVERYKGARFSGPVTYIVDGDGLCVGREQGGIEVRLADFNAFELYVKGRGRTYDPEGLRAKQALERIVFGKFIECSGHGRHGDRVIGRCTLNGKPLGDLMRAAGVPEGGR